MNKNTYKYNYKWVILFNQLPIAKLVLQIFQIFHKEKEKNQEYLMNQKKKTSCHVV